MPYKHKEIEKKWQKYWEENQTFRTPNPQDKDFDPTKPKYYVLDMFPYPSWAGLHVGHPEGYTANDIIARYFHAKWHNVLHPMWWDAFGLPAENYAIKTWTHPEITTNKNIENFKRQIKSLWFSYDRNREISTTDPKYYKRTQWIFLKMFEHWLAYEQDLPINYCPSCKTWLANEEVLNDGTCERCWTKVIKKPIRQWVLAITKYADRLAKDVEELDWPEWIKQMQKNWIWRSEWTQFKMDVVDEKNNKIWEIEVYTTRIDTVFGMTYAVIAPDHKNVKKFIQKDYESECLNYIQEAINKSDLERTTENKEKTWVFTWSYVINPYNWKKVPLWISDYVLWHYWTGAVMAVPAHDERDFKFAQKYNLEIIQVIKPKNNKEITLPYTEYGILINSGDFSWLTSEEAKKVLTEYAEKKWFWFKKVNYKLRDWIFSRQRYWWEPIPLIHISNEDFEKLPTITEEELNNLQNEIENLITKKMGVATPIIGGGSHNGTQAKLPSANNIFKSIPKVKKKRKKSFQLKKVFKEVNLNNKTVRISWKHLVGHFLKKSRGEYIRRFQYAYTILENLEKVKFLSDTFWLLNIDWEYWCIILEKVDNNTYDLVTFYRFKSLNSKLNKAYILYKNEQKLAHHEVTKDWKVAYLVVNGKIFSKVYNGIYWKIVIDWNLPLTLPNVEKYEPAWDWQSPLARIDNWVNVKLAENLTGKRETNTMPQWWGSCWYYLRFMDPWNDKELVSKEAERYWKQVDSYVWWAEHAVLHLLYARFWHKFLYDIWVVSTKEPFKRLRNQWLILSYAYERKNGWLVAVDLVEEKDWKYYHKETGEELKRVIAKMSKSLKNVVNPDDIVNEYWADSLRLYEMYMADFKDSAPWDTKWIVWVRRFLDKIYRYFIENEPKYATDDKEAIRLLHKTIKKVSQDIENYKFNTAIAALIILLNYWIPKDQNLQKTWKETFAKLLHPFAPHLAEEIWFNLKWKPDNYTSIFFEPWPEYDEKLAEDESIKIAIQVMWKLRSTIEVQKNASKEEVLEKAKQDPKVKKYLEWKTIVKEIYVPGKIVNFVVK